MTADLVELDNTKTMTPEQALARAGREDFKAVAILGVLENDDPVFIFSDYTDVELYWLMSKARRYVFDGEFNDEEV